LIEFVSCNISQSNHSKLCPLPMASSHHSNLFIKWMKVSLYWNSFNKDNINIFTYIYMNVPRKNTWQQASLHLTFEPTWKQNHPTQDSVQCSNNFTLLKTEEHCTFDLKPLMNVIQICNRGLKSLHQQKKDVFYWLLKGLSLDIQLSVKHALLLH